MNQSIRLLVKRKWVGAGGFYWSSAYDGLRDYEELYGVVLVPRGTFIRNYSKTLKRAWERVEHCATVLYDRRDKKRLSRLGTK